MLLLPFTNVCVRSAAQSCLTLCNTMHCRPPGSSVHRIFQARILEQVDISYSRGSSWPRDWTHPASPALVGRFFTAELPGKPLQVMSISQNKKATQQLTLLLFVARKYRDAGPTVIFTCKWAWKDSCVIHTPLQTDRYDLSKWSQKKTLSIWILWRI